MCIISIYHVKSLYSLNLSKPRIMVNYFRQLTVWSILNSRQCSDSSMVHAHQNSPNGYETNTIITLLAWFFFQFERYFLQKCLLFWLLKFNIYVVDVLLFKSVRNNTIFRVIIFKCNSEIWKRFSDTIGFLIFYSQSLEFLP